MIERAFGLKVLVSLFRVRTTEGMKTLALAALLALSACATAPASAQPRAAACAPLGMSRAEVDALKAAEWAIADEARRNAFALALAECLGDPDPAVRDGLAFEGLQHLMRNRQLNATTLDGLRAQLLSNLAAPDPQGFRSSFSALVLADVVRTDRIEAWMTPAQRTQLLDGAVRYLTNLRDHRGFDPREGYRHAPAHAGDLMMQIVLNTNYDKAALVRVRDAVGAQIAPEGVSYITGESERLARPILYMAQRNVFSEAEWTAWFTQLAGPGPLGQSWDGWFQSQAGLSRRHNLMMFLGIMHANVTLSDNAAFAPMRPGVAAGLAALP
ncbi:hypothetical protein U91I_01331 [alpha proteobacterium U9-1i]|nr:hypothetical protein U91I_01331 [alpha proteobacterium U9-1i]